MILARMAGVRRVFRDGRPGPGIAARIGRGLLTLGNESRRGSAWRRRTSPAEGEPRTRRARPQSARNRCLPTRTAASHRRCVSRRTRGPRTTCRCSRPTTRCASPRCRIASPRRGARSPIPSGSCGGCRYLCQSRRRRPSGCRKSNSGLLLVAPLPGRLGEHSIRGCEIPRGQPHAHGPFRSGRAVCEDAPDRHPLPCARAVEELDRRGNAGLCQHLAIVRNDDPLVGRWGRGPGLGGRQQPVAGGRDAHEAREPPGR